MLDRVDCLGFALDAEKNRNPVLVSVPESGASSGSGSKLRPGKEEEERENEEVDAKKDGQDEGSKVIAEIGSNDDDGMKKKMMMMMKKKPAMLRQSQLRYRIRDTAVAAYCFGGRISIFLPRRESCPIRFRAQ